MSSAGDARARQPAGSGHGGPDSADVEQADGERDRGDRETAAPGGGGAPRSAGAPGAAGDDLDDVVVGEFRPVEPARHEVEQLAVAYALHGEAAHRIEFGTGGAPQRPAAVVFAVVGEFVTGEPQQVRQQLGDERVAGQRHVDPPFRRRHGHPRARSGPTAAVTPLISPGVGCRFAELGAQHAAGRAQTCAQSRGAASRGFRGAGAGPSTGLRYVSSAPAIGGSTRGTGDRQPTAAPTGASRFRPARSCSSRRRRSRPRPARAGAGCSPSCRWRPAPRRWA